MGRTYTFVAIVISFLLTKAMNTYTRFLLSVEPDNFFQKLLIFVVMLWLTVGLMTLVGEALVPGREHRSVVSGQSPNLDYWGWYTGNLKRAGCLSTLQGLITAFAVWLVLTHLITWSSPALFFRFFGAEGRDLVLFWHWWSSLFLELPSYLVFIYYIFRPFGGVRG